MYCTTDDLLRAMSIRTLTELSNDDPDATDPCAEVVDLAIQMACEEIDGYLRSRYLLPLSETPTVVKRLAIDLARYHLYARRPEGYDFPEAIKSLHQQALKRLDEIRDGKFALGEAVGERVGQAIREPGEIRVAKRGRVFGLDTLSQY